MLKRLEKQSNFPLLKKVSREFSWAMHQMTCLGRLLALKVKIISRYICHYKLQELIFVIREIMLWVSEGWWCNRTQWISMLASKLSAVSHLCWKLQVSTDWWNQIYIGCFSSRFSNEQCVVLCDGWEDTSQWRGF